MLTIKTLPLSFLTFCGGLCISDIFFWKVDKWEVLEVLRSFYISRHLFSQIFRTSFNKLGNLKGHILELNKKCEVINATGAKHQVGEEEIRVKLKLYETYLMTALLYGLET